MIAQKTNQDTTGCHTPYSQFVMDETSHKKTRTTISSVSFLLLPTLYASSTMIPQKPFSHIPKHARNNRCRNMVQDCFLPTRLISCLPK